MDRDYGVVVQSVAARMYSENPQMWVYHQSGNLRYEGWGEPEIVILWWQNLTFPAFTSPAWAMFPNFGQFYE